MKGWGAAGLGGCGAVGQVCPTASTPTPRGHGVSSGGSSLTGGRLSRANVSLLLFEHKLLRVPGAEVWVPGTSGEWGGQRSRGLGLPAPGRCLHSSPPLPMGRQCGDLAGWRSRSVLRRCVCPTTATDTGLHPHGWGISRSQRPEAQSEVAGWLLLDGSVPGLSSFCWSPASLADRSTPCSRSPSSPPPLCVHVCIPTSSSYRDNGHVWLGDTLMTSPS